MAGQIELGRNVVTGNRTRFGSFVVVEDGVVIGNNVVIENFVEIMEGSIIGDGSVIRSFTRIGPGNVLGKGVIVKCSAITGPEVEIADGCFIGPQAIFFSDLTSKISQTFVDYGSFIGGGSRVMPGLHIGRDVFVGAASFVNKDIPDGELWVGNPAKRKGKNEYKQFWL
jgi:acetyltransferase-like isoleucine patch superfamily enzyme